MNEPMERSDAVSSVTTDVILTVLTCGIYGIFWQARIFRAVNAFLGREKFSTLLWILLSLITCGIYNIFAQYELSKAINEVQAKVGKKVNEHLALLNVLLSFFALHLVSNAINQIEINAWYE
jgi:hypothetical protein